MTVAALDHEHYDLGALGRGRFLVGFELVSVILLIVVFFPLLVARLALFEGETVTAKDLNQIAKLSTDPLEEREFTLTIDTPVKWEVNRTDGYVPTSVDKAVRLLVNEKGHAKIEKASTG